MEKTVRRRIPKVDLRDAMALIKKDPSILNVKKKDIRDKLLREDSDGLIQRWKDSGMTDYGIYDDPRYLSELFICYDCATKGSIGGLIRHLENKKDWQNLTIFEDYNGVGLGTTDLVLAGFKSVDYFNDVEWQAKMSDEVFEFYKIKKPNRLLKRPIRKTYDIVLSLEVAEHILEPMPYLEHICRLVKPGGHLVYGSCFAGRNIFVGHFSEYRIDGQMVAGRKASKVTKDFIKSQFDLVYKGFNGKPEIFQKRS